MGTLMGHLLPGGFFILFSLWWCVCICYQHFVTSRQHGKKKFRSLIAYPCCWCSSWPTESTLQVACCLIGMIGEIATGIYTTDQGVSMLVHNVQHTTMFLFFALAASVNTLRYLQIAMPLKIEYVVLAMAYAVEGYLFYFHLHGRDMYDIRVHTLLVMAIALCVVSTLWEMQSPEEVLPGLCRCLFTMLQGTWFCHVGFALYPPGGENYTMEHITDEDDQHKVLMTTTVAFAWHTAIDLCILILIGFIVSCCVKRRDKGTNDQTKQSLLGNAKMQDDFDEP